jgi:hypothetical protein
MSESTPTAAASCWNCAQPLKPGAEQCVFCGVSQQQQPAVYLVAPDAAPGTANEPVQTWTPAGSAVTTASSSGAVLDPAFAGTAASVGSQIAAFTVDVAVVVAGAAAVLAITGTPVFAVLAIFELSIAIWVLEARTGATVGKFVFRIRVSRNDVPFSPGIGRALVRRMVTAVGFILAVVGAWVVAASGAWDRSGRGRSWGDIAAHTQIVAVPRRARAQARVVRSPRTVDAVSPAAALAAPQVVSTLARSQPVDEDSIAQSQTGANGRTALAAAEGAAPTVPSVSQPMAVVPTGIAQTEASDGSILLVFDTGQREQFPTPVAVNLGRNPVATEPGDMLVTVQDPEMTVSKTHLRLEHSRGRSWVTDGGSTNGTELLDDEGGVTVLAAGERVLLDEGVRVRVGNRAFTISLILGGEK